MATISCFSALLAGRKKSKSSHNDSYLRAMKINRCVKPQDLVGPVFENYEEEISFNVSELLGDQESGVKHNIRREMGPKEDYDGGQEMKILSCHDEQERVGGEFDRCYPIQFHAESTNDARVIGSEEEEDEAAVQEVIINSGNAFNVSSLNRADRKATKEIENQSVDFAEPSFLDRVNSWMNSPEDGLLDAYHDVDNDNVGGEFGIGQSIRNDNSLVDGHKIDEYIGTHKIAGALNTRSAMANISGMGLANMPTMSAFTSLRAVNLSGNSIVHIAQGSLPESLQDLDLSRNKIGIIQGFKERTRLRFLNLSYNRISRIGQGLSSCTAIKELYLAGNKISDVEGLHRLLKLTVVDLSFNRITTAKALGQLAANYNSILALDLLGNPIHSTVGDDRLRKIVCGLLPPLVYLNKQSIKPPIVKDMAMIKREWPARGVGPRMETMIKSRAMHASSRRGSRAGRSSGTGGRYRSRGRI